MGLFVGDWVHVVLYDIILWMIAGMQRKQCLGVRLGSLTEIFFKKKGGHFTYKVGDFFVCLT